MKNFIKIVTPFFEGSDKLYARGVGIVLLLLSQLMTSFGYFFIQWNRRFYDALEAKNGELFFKESLVFAGLVICFGLISCVTRYIGQRYALRWRIWMTHQALSFWLNTNSRDKIEGADQRIQEDLMRFTTIFERFFLACFNAIMLILLFTPLLFSQTVSLYLGGYNLTILLLISVITYTVIGMIVAARIGNPLIQYEYNNQKIEAEFRYNLVHARDGVDIKIGFFKGIINTLSDNYNKIYNRQKYFNYWQYVYHQFSILIPFSLLATNYFAGLLTLGMLMQIKSTFSRIRDSMAYLLDHYPELTEMLAISRRLAEFYDHAPLSTMYPTTTPNTKQLATA